MTYAVVHFFVILCVSFIGRVVFILSLLFVILTVDTSEINLMDGWMDGWFCAMTCDIPALC